MSDPDAAKSGQPQMEPLLKIPSGIKGLDKITQGGLPKGRAVLVAGGPGSGKTLLGIQPA